MCQLFNCHTPSITLTLKVDGTIWSVVMPQKKSKKPIKVKVTSHRGTETKIVKPKTSSPRPKKKTSKKVQWKSAGAASYNRNKKKK